VWESFTQFWKDVARLASRMRDSHLSSCSTSEDHTRGRTSKGDSLALSSSIIIPNITGALHHPDWFLWNCYWQNYDYSTTAVVPMIPDIRSLYTRGAQEPIYFMIATMQPNCKEKHKALGIQPLKPNPPANHKIGGCDERHKTPKSLRDWSFPSSRKNKRHRLKKLKWKWRLKGDIVNAHQDVWKP
jgi:hypothetical protein